MTACCDGSSNMCLYDFDGSNFTAPPCCATNTCEFTCRHPAGPSAMIKYGFCDGEGNGWGNGITKIGTLLDMFLL